MDCHLVKSESIRPHRDCCEYGVPPDRQAPLTLMTVRPHGGITQRDDTLPTLTHHGIWPRGNSQVLLRVKNRYSGFIFPTREPHRLIAQYTPRYHLPVWYCSCSVPLDICLQKLEQLESSRSCIVDTRYGVPHVQSVCCHAPRTPHTHSLTP